MDHAAHGVAQVRAGGEDLADVPGVARLDHPPARRPDLEGDDLLAERAFLQELRRDGELLRREGIPRREVLHAGGDETVDVERRRRRRALDDAVLDLPAHPPADPDHARNEDQQADEHELLRQCPLPPEPRQSHRLAPRSLFLVPY